MTGCIVFAQEAAGFDDFALDLKNPDFVKCAEAYGAKGYKIREVPLQLSPARSATAIPRDSVCVCPLYRF